MNAIYKRIFWTLGGWFTSVWIGIATAAIGAGTVVYGAQQQKKLNQAAQNTNANLQGLSNDSAWQSYLLTRGINPAGATAGTIPNNAQAVNVKMPLWAGVSRTGTAAPGFRVGKTTGPKIAVLSNFNQPAPATAVASTSGAQPSTQDKISTGIGQFFNPFDSSKDLLGIFG